MGEANGHKAEDWKEDAKDLANDVLSSGRLPHGQANEVVCPEGPQNLGPKWALSLLQGNVFRVSCGSSIVPQVCLP